MTKVKREKILQFTGFHPSVGKPFVVFTVWKVLKKAIAQMNFSLENSQFIENPRNCGTFFPLDFCRLWYIMKLVNLKLL